MKIVMLEPLAVSQDVLEELAVPLREQGHSVDFCLAPLSEEEKAEKAKEADVLIIASSPLSTEVLEAAPGVKMISVGFTGVDHVPGDYVTAQDIVVSNAQGYATTAVRDVVFGLVFALLRNIIPCDAVTRQGGTKDGLVGNEIEGKTFGIIGYGAIGSKVGQLAKALDCRVLAFCGEDGCDDADVEAVSLETLLRESDIVSLHVPLTEATKGLLGKEELALMKPTAFLINTARGPVVDTEALAEALNTGVIAGAGLDVFDTEPPLPLDEPLLKAKNTVVTPHIGFSTKESMEKRANIVFENIEMWLEGTPINVKEF